MERIVLTHLSGSKAKQEDQFPLDQFKEITIGRDPSSSVIYEEGAGTVVGRQHARITRNPALPHLFFITDLNSRNGTFVNGQRIVGIVGLNPGDVVQCGIGGPEFRFRIEPETESLTANLIPQTANLLEQPRPQPASPALPHAATSGAGIALRKPWVVGGGVVVGLIALVAGVLLYRGGGPTGSGGGGKSAPASQPTALPNSNAGKYDHVHLSGGDTADAEKDAERTAWRIEAAPYLALGSGHPGKAASDFDKPDGIAFSPAGLLFATDAKNRRVQIWDVKTGSHLGEFGHGVFGGEIVDIAITPDNTVLVTDQTLNLAYVFVPPPPPGALPAEKDEKSKPLGPYDYQFKGTRFGEQGFKKLGGIAVDSRGRIYAVDAHRNDVLRFTADGKPDKTWKFEKARADGDTYLHGCEGIAIDETTGNLFIASEKDAVIEVFDWETGAYKHQFVGASQDASDHPAGKHVFFGSVEGLAIAQHHLLAVDESAGHIQVFDLSRPDAFNTDLAGYAAPRPHRPAGYQGFFGHAPQVDFEDKTNIELQHQVKVGSIIPGQSNPPGYFCSPDSIASYTDPANGETYIAIADQCNYRIVVYRWSDVARAMDAAVAKTVATPAVAMTAASPTVKQAATVSKVAAIGAGLTAVAAGSRTMTPRRPRVARANRPIAPIKSGNAVPGKAPVVIYRSMGPAADKKMKKMEKARLKQEKKMKSKP